MYCLWKCLIKKVLLTLLTFLSENIYVLSRFKAFILLWFFFSSVWRQCSSAPNFQGGCGVLAKMLWRNYATPPSPLVCLWPPCCGAKCAGDTQMVMSLPHSGDKRTWLAPSHAPALSPSNPIPPLPCENYKLLKRRGFLLFPRRTPWSWREFSFFRAVEHEMHDKWRVVIRKALQVQAWVLVRTSPWSL